MTTTGAKHLDDTQSRADWAQRYCHEALALFGPPLQCVIHPAGQAPPSYRGPVWTWPDTRTALIGGTGMNIGMDIGMVIDLAVSRWSRHAGRAGAA